HGSASWLGLPIGARVRTTLGASLCKGSRMGIESATRAAAPLFHLVMIKPTHYDDNGYPIQWLRSAIPSNTLACLNGLAEDALARHVLGEGVEIRLHTDDATNTRG